MKTCYKILLLFSLIFLGFAFKASFAHAADRYWVGGTDNWNSTAGSKWATTSGGAGGAAVPTSADDVFFDAQSASTSPTVTLTVDRSAKSVNFTGYTAIFTHNDNIDLTVSGSVTFVSGMTYNIGGSASRIAFAADGTLTTGTKLMPKILLNGSGVDLTLGDNLNFADYKTLSLLATYSNNTINMAGFTISGNSSINRILIANNTLGTSWTITLNGGTFANADFRDVNLSSSADLSAITGGSGDCGGNTNITFTTAQTNYWIGGTGSWSDVNEWANSSGGGAASGRVPLPQDDVVFDNNSFSGAQTVSADMPRLGKNLDFSAYNEASAAIVSWAISSASIFGSFTFSNNMNDGYGVTTDVLFYGRGSHTITMAGEAYGGGGGFGIYAYGGTYTLLDAIPSVPYFVLSNGTFDANDFNVTIGYFSSNNSNTRTLNMGSGTWTLTLNYAATIWNMTTTSGLTLNEETSTIVITDTGTAAKTFIGGGQTYNNITFSGNNITVTGSNTFNTFALNALNTNGVKLTENTTQTINYFTSNGNDDNKPKLRSTTTTNAILAFTGGNTTCENYIDVDYITGTPDNAWYVGTNSTNGGNNSGLYFSGNCALRSTNLPSEKVRGGTKVRGGVKFR